MSKEEFNLSEKIKKLFEVEYLDTMADVQGDVTLLLKEFIKLLKKEINDFDETTMGDARRNELIDKLAGEKLK